ncbi:MAG TPA: hypothetical protein PJ991_03955 [Kiritimatiellia bacterium]|nr:hypothetical protein [Kiritimatiellia bacterium]
MTFGIQHLSNINIALGVLTGMLSLIVFTLPNQLRTTLSTFPRNKFAGLILTAIGLLWAAFLVDQMTLGDLSRFKWILYIITPISFYLIIQYLDELLAARAFAGIIMLVPTIMVDAARWHPSAWRYVTLVFAYILVVIGIWLILCPYKFRIWSSWWMDSESRRNVGGFIAAAVTVSFFIAAVMTRI